MHIILNIFYKVQKLCVVLHTRFFNYLFKVCKKLDVSARDDNKLHFGSLLRKSFVEAQHACNTERTCHKQNCRLVRIKSFTLTNRLFVKRLCKTVKNRNAERIYYALVNTVFINKLCRHIRLCKHICVNIRNNICSVCVIVSYKADCLNINLVLTAKL